MKKEIRVTKENIVQVTTTDERWYARPATDPVTGLPTHEFVPSVTWITHHYPKGIGFLKWMAEKGWDEAEAIKQAAGDKGSKVHAAIACLLSGSPVAMDQPFLNPGSGNLEPLTTEEYQCVLSFANWHAAMTPELVHQDIVVWSETEHYAGTVDAVFRINGMLWVVDFKTSKSIWPGHRMQVSAYKHADRRLTTASLAILQIGYDRNQLGYKWTPVDDCYGLFLHCKGIWAEETRGQVPSQKDYPLSISLTHTAQAAAGSASAAKPEQNGGATNVTSGGRAASDRVRKGRGRRVVGGTHRGSPVPTRSPV